MEHHIECATLYGLLLVLSASRAGVICYIAEAHVIDIEVEEEG